MKIISVANTTFSKTGGLARCVIVVGEALRKRGHSVTFLLSEDVGGCKGGKGLSLVTFPFFVVISILRCIKKENGCDIVVMHSLSAFVYVFLRMIVRSLPPCVVLSAGDDMLRWSLEREEERLGLIRLSLKAKILYFNFVIRPSRFALRHADHIITPVTAEKEFYCSSLGLSPDKISLVHSPVTTNCFTNRTFKERPDRLLFFGGWEWRKGTRYLLQAFERICDSHPYVRLTLAGVGLSAQEMRPRLPEPLRDRIDVIPFVSEDQVPGLYAQHDIFLFPSLMEAMPLVVLEAMASGMPVVTTNACGMKDAIEDGVSGFLVPLRDAQMLARKVQLFLDDVSLCKRIGMNAQQRAQALSLESCVEKTSTVYERVIKECSLKKNHGRK
ncbi:MAG: glycosyltransferase family 4 protein [Candidatus Omnitrophica bacterium]|nr:glycosyltransferase family 4 protein [Candidatus Omnitrophota bacterium]